MADATGRPQRMRYSFEARCRAVALMRAGVSPGAAAATVRREPRHWLSLAGAVPGRGLAGAARASVHAEAAAPPPQRGGRSHDPGRPRAQWGRPAHARCAARSARLDHRQGAAAAGAFATPTTPAAAGHTLRARPAGRSAAPGHQEAGPLLARRQAHPPRWQRSPRAGWQHVHIAIDDHSRLAYAEVRSSDRQTDALAFLERALAWYHAQGFRVREVMTDNGPAYRSRAWRAHCAARGLGHRRTRPYTPRTNARPSALSRSSCGAGPTA